MVVGVLELHGVEGRVARPVHDETLVPLKVLQQEVVALIKVVALVGEDVVGAPVAGVGRVTAVDAQAAA